MILHIIKCITRSGQVLKEPYYLFFSRLMCMSQYLLVSATTSACYCTHWILLNHLIIPIIWSFMVTVKMDIDSFEHLRMQFLRFLQVSKLVLYLFGINFNSINVKNSSKCVEFYLWMLLVWLFESYRITSVLRWSLKCVSKDHEFLVL